MDELSFHELDDENLRTLLLTGQRDRGEFVRRCGGYSGNIYVFRYSPQTYPSHICAKVPKTSRSVDPLEAAQRFLREMKIQRRLFYQQFVHWPFDFDFILDAPVAWFRLWDGDLSQLIEDPSFTVTGRLSMLAYITAGMMHCHRTGLVAHQDFKPENIFVRDLRQAFRDVPEVDVFRIPKIADFGSANLAAEKGIFRGTRPYMAVEQWDKKPLGQHTTVWSIGVMTYELLSYGRHPIGEPSRPWRDEEPHVIQRWQDDRMWKRWRETGMVPATPLADSDMDGFVRECLRSEPATRPTLDAALERLLRRLRSESPEAYDQARFRITHAEHEAKDDYVWPYLDERYEWLVDQVTRYFEKKIA
ncbi:protein kinase [Mesorhizobium sp. M1322]|uniref:protein kinase domain-containing protein n=1 Tax=Mesorhizobium sp. M1322 TaxID=2957081 RepID=UPI0033358E58